MKRSLMDLLACPMCKHDPLELHELESKDDIIVEAVILCPKCQRFYPVREEVPCMLPDDLRDTEEDLAFLTKWREKLPEELKDHEAKLRSRNQHVKDS